MKTDIFIPLHNMLRQGELEAVLNQILDFDKGVIQKPYDTELNHAWYIVGDIYFRLNDFVQALSAFREAFLKNKNDYQAAEAIGNCYSELSRYKMAERFYKKAILLNKDDIAFVYNLANCYFDQKKFKEAMREYRIVINSEEGDSSLLKQAKNNFSVAKIQIETATK